MAISDARGIFRLEDVPAGASVVRVRRLGFRPDSFAVHGSASADATVSLRLARISVALAPVVVRASKVKHLARLAGFDERLERRTAGHVITYGEIQFENPRNMTHLLQHVPGLTVVKGRAGATGVRMRGRTCWPLVWLDSTTLAPVGTNIAPNASSAYQSRAAGTLFGRFTTTAAPARLAQASGPMAPAAPTGTRPAACVNSAGTVLSAYCFPASEAGTSSPQDAVSFNRPVVLYLVDRVPGGN